MNKNQEKLIEIISSEPLLKEAFLSVEKIGPDFWISAGFIRNNYWNLISNKPIDLTCDVDVIYFDKTNICKSIEVEFQNKLKEKNAQYNWSVKNQARMSKNNSIDYRNLEDALSKFPETATCVAMKYSNNAYEVLSPHGLEDLYNFTIRPTPIFKNDYEIIKKRVEKKDWSRRWPHIKLII